MRISDKRQIGLGSCDLIEVEFSTVKTSGRISDWQSLSSKFCNINKLLNPNLP